MECGQLRGGEYGFGGFDSKQYCDEAKNGDIVHIYLDLDKNQLSFSVNDKKSPGKAFDIVQDQLYRTIISLDLEETKIIPSGIWMYLFIEEMVHIFVVKKLD